MSLSQILRNIFGRMVAHSIFNELYFWEVIQGTGSCKKCKFCVDVSENKLFKKPVRQLLNYHLQNIISQLLLNGFGKMMIHLISNELYFKFIGGARHRIVGINWKYSNSYYQITTQKSIKNLENLFHIKPENTMKYKKILEQKKTAFFEDWHYVFSIKESPICDNSSLSGTSQWCQNI